MDRKSTLEYFDRLAADIAAGSNIDSQTLQLWRVVAFALEIQGYDMQGQGWGIPTQDAFTFGAAGQLLDPSSGRQFRAEAELVCAPVAGAHWKFYLRGFAPEMDSLSNPRQLLVASEMVISEARRPHDNSHDTDFRETAEYHFDTKGTKHFALGSELQGFCQRFAFWLNDALAP